MAKLLKLLLLREKNVVCPYQTASNKLYILVQLFKSQNSSYSSRIPKTINDFLHEIFTHFEMLSII